MISFCVHRVAALHSINITAAVTANFSLIILARAVAASVQRVQNRQRFEFWSCACVKLG